MPGTKFVLEVQPRLPAALARLQDLAGDLYYSWNRSVLNLFSRLDRQLWERTGHNPRVFLRRVSQRTLEEAALDRVYMQEFNQAVAAYDTYMSMDRSAVPAEVLDPATDLIAYSCFEYGIHESFPLYSGGLGILAGDHCKAASDMGVPFVAIGMLYRLGFFRQEIDGQGNQVVRHPFTHYDDVPMQVVTDAQGEEIRLAVDLPGRAVQVRIWHARCGHISLYLLDADVEQNSEADRRISYQLYGGDSTTRIQQEMVLGVGGVRAMRALGLAPTVWHINEGHAAFQILERCREKVAQGLDFDSALEAVAAATVFTTHTPVPAGHDVFDPALAREYLQALTHGAQLTEQQLLALGAAPGHDERFNMTALGLRGSRFRNGVSRIHGGVVSQMEAHIWPQVPPEENPISYVTNGVHVPTFLAQEWAALFDMQFGGDWRNRLLDEAFWERVEEIPDHSYWSVCKTLKARMLEDMSARLARQLSRNGLSGSQIERMTAHMNPAETDVLTVGFARRFATYKRAALIFSDPDRLARLLRNPQRPVVLVFAGKAHPSDQPGQDLIRQVHHISRQPQFEGHVLLLEDYDLAMARKLLPGVDVWLNTPEYPMEASGTSGQKAAINGVVNLSVLDGWWAEGFDGSNGYGIAPYGVQFDAHTRSHEEANDMLDQLEHHLIPRYYDRNGHGFSESWVRMSKAAMKTIMPRFNAARMLRDYVHEFYGPAATHGRRLASDNHQWAQRLSHWKANVAQAWPNISMRRLDAATEQLHLEQPLHIPVGVQLSGLDVGDVVLECLLGELDGAGEFVMTARHKFDHTGQGDDNEAQFELELRPGATGLQAYKIRLYPHHPMIGHRFEAGRMLWL